MTAYPAQYWEILVSLIAETFPFLKRDTMRRTRANCSHHFSAQNHFMSKPTTYIKLKKKLHIHRPHTRKRIWCTFAYMPIRKPYSIYIDIVHIECHSHLITSRMFILKEKIVLWWIWLGRRSTCTATAFIHLPAQCALGTAHMNKQTNGFWK